MALNHDAVKMNIAKELEDRERRKKELEALDANYVKVSDAIDEISRGLAGLIVKTDAVLKTGKSTAKIDEQLIAMKSSKTLLEERLLRLKSADGKGLIPETKRELDAAEKALQTAMVKALQVAKNETAERMSGLFKKAMDAYDDYSQDAETLCAGLGVKLHTGTKDLSPLADEPRLWQLMENGFLKSPVPVIVVPTEPEPAATLGPGPKTKQSIPTPETEPSTTAKPSMSELCKWEREQIASEPVTKQAEADKDGVHEKEVHTNSSRFGG